MAKTDRFIILVAFAALLTGAAPKQASGCEGTSKPNLPCDAISAQAAIDQANYAFSQAIIGGFGLLLGIGTLTAAFLAGKWAKKAAEHTARGADEAQAQVALARRAQRPWIAISLIPIELTVTGQDVAIRCKITFKNVGALVATHFVHIAQMRFVTPDDPSVHNIGISGLENVPRKEEQVLLPGQEFSLTRNIKSNELPDSEKRVILGHDGKPFAIMPVIVVTAYFRSEAKPIGEEDTDDHLSTCCFNILHDGKAIYLSDKTVAAPALSVSMASIQFAT